MKTNFRQGILGHQTLGNGTQDFIKDINGSGNLSLVASDRPTTVTVAHADSNYTFTEDNTVENAWVGAFGAGDYWLYWNFDQLTFQRTFGYTTLEPVVQNVEPGSGDVEIMQTIPGSMPGVGAFIVDGYFLPPIGKPFDVVGSSTNDGTYTVMAVLYDEMTGYTQISVHEDVVAPGTELGEATLDVDLTGAPYVQNGRHWYNTDENRHYVYDNGMWREVIRVFAAHVRNGGIISHSIDAPKFTGTQIGDTSTAFSGRVIYDGDSNVFRRDNGTFFTTEDQFFANSARVDGIRLESNVIRAQFTESYAAESSIVAFVANGHIRAAGYNDVGQTVVGVLTEDLHLDEVGAVIVQGTVTNDAWNWTTGPSAVPVGTPLWVENGLLVPYDPHVYNNRARTPIVGVDVANQWFEVAGAYAALGFGTVVGVTGNSANNDGNYRVVDTEYNATTDRTKVFVEETIIDPIAAGEMLFRIGNYPVGQVPVARVIDNNTVIFEQGLGGKGDRGPAGSVENMPTATIIDLGAVFLSLPAEDPEIPLVVGDNDPRMSDPRQPLAHTHPATEINVDTIAGITGTTAQAVFEELQTEKLEIAGGTMTGYLTLFDDPVNPLHAATKRYVDSLVAGLVWLNPICAVNMIGDDVTTPPATPEYGDSYIIPPAGGTLAWAAIPAGNVVTWDGSVWVDRGPVTGFSTTGARFGIAMQSTTVPTGTFAGHANEIAMYDPTGVFIGFEVPTENNAVFVCSDSDLFAFNQFAFSGTEWILFGGAQALTPDEITITQNGNIISAKQFADGGEIDAKYWQGLVPSDLNSLYAPVSHTHAATDITVAPFVSPVPGLGDIVATDLQAALEETYNEKASLQPSYADFASLPDPSTYNGMLAHTLDTGDHFVAQNGVWERLVVYPLSIPYDVSFFLAGQMLFASAVTGSFLATRVITIPPLAPGSLARCKVAPQTDVTYQLIVDDGVSTTPIGDVTFLAGNRNGTITLTLGHVLLAGQELQMITPAVLEGFIQDVSVTFVGCAQAPSCA